MLSHKHRHAYQLFFIPCDLKLPKLASSDGSTDSHTSDDLVLLLRFKHMQIRSNCESAAFYRCGHLEMSKANDKLSRLISLQHRLIFRQYILQCK